MRDIVRPEQDFFSVPGGEGFLPEQQGFDVNVAGGSAGRYHAQPQV
jgi:hypothetical protein